MKLTLYGIQNEQSDIRIHVCVKAKHVYIYETENALNAITTKQFRQAPAYTNGKKTANGYLVPPDAIENCRSIPIPDSWFADLRFSESDTTSTKGRNALLVVERLAKTYGIPIPSNIVIADGIEDQLQGIDAVLQKIPEKRIQVKCDWNGGKKEHGGTGNLYLQVAESNPYRQV